MDDVKERIRAKILAGEDIASIAKEEGMSIEEVGRILGMEVKSEEIEYVKAEDFVKSDVERQIDVVLGIQYSRVLRFLSVEQKYGLGLPLQAFNKEIETLIKLLAMKQKTKVSVDDIIRWSYESDSG